MLAEALADLPFDLVGAREKRRKIAVLRDPLFGRDLADPRHALDVVHAVAHEREDVRDLAGRDSEELADSRFV